MNRFVLSPVTGSPLSLEYHDQKVINHVQFNEILSSSPHPHTNIPISVPVSTPKYNQLYQPTFNKQKSIKALKWNGVKSLLPACDG